MLNVSCAPSPQNQAEPEVQHFSTCIINQPTIYYCNILSTVAIPEII